jgi:hypothetical protein
MQRRAFVTGSAAINAVERICRRSFSFLRESLATGRGWLVADDEPAPL